MTISKLTIQSRFKPNHQLLVAHPGPYSPMIKIEPLLLDMLLQLSDMNAPVTCREGLELARSLVKDSSMIEEIKSWKDKHLCNDESDDCNDDDGTEVIGKAWWSGFCRCHKNLLTSKKAVRFDSFHDEWCTVCNFERMYEKVYACMVDCGVAVKWADGPIWFNHEGEVVETEGEAFGRKSEYELI